MIKAFKVIHHYLIVAKDNPLDQDIEIQLYETENGDERCVRLFANRYYDLDVTTFSNEKITSSEAVRTDITNLFVYDPSYIEGTQVSRDNIIELVLSNLAKGFKK